jgi:hypothetical protein
MKKRRWKSVLALLLLIIMITSNSVVAFAAHAVDADTTTVEFIGFDGTEYPITDYTIANTFSSSHQALAITDGLTCPHYFVAGYYIIHTKNSNGSCNRYVYNATICTLCNVIYRGSLYSSSYYPICPH